MIGQSQRVKDLETQVERLEKLLEDAQDDLRQERSRYQALVDRMLAMKQQGFDSPPVFEPGPVPEPLPVAVQEALLAVNEPGLEDFARVWLSAGVDAGEVVGRILEGGRLT